jgi:hypothetical protein
MSVAFNWHLLVSPFIRHLQPILLILTGGRIATCKKYVAQLNDAVSKQCNNRVDRVIKHDLNVVVQCTSTTVLNRNQGNK